MFISFILLGFGNTIIYNQMSHNVAVSFPSEKRGLAISIVCLMVILCGMCDIYFPQLFVNVLQNNDPIPTNTTEYFNQI